MKNYRFNSQRQLLVFKNKTKKKLPPPPPSRPLSFSCTGRHNSSVLPKQFHSPFFQPVRRWLRLRGGKLEFISCDRAPLVAHFLIAHSLMCFISGRGAFFFFSFFLGTHISRAAPKLWKFVTQSRFWNDRQVARLWKHDSRVQGIIVGLLWD